VSVFESNLAVLEGRWPAFARLVLAQDVESLAVELLEGKESTIAVHGIQLSSRHDRAGEARLQAGSVVEGASSIHLYGIGLGDLPPAFLAREGLHRLEVRIMNETIFALLLRVLDQTSWLSDPRLGLALAGDEGEIQLPFFVSPPELFLASNYNAKIRDRLEAEVAIPVVNARFDPNDPERAARIESNLALLRDDRDVAELFASQAGKDIFVIATGPTLASHYAVLREAVAQSDPPLLICVDTALAPLLDNGIRPDFVVTADQLITRRILPGEASAGIGLVYFPVLENALLQAWRGPRYAAYSKSPVFDQLRLSIEKAMLYADGSVLHSAVDLAVKMGAAQVTLFGADFAFVGGAAHAGWQTGELAPAFETSHWVLNGRGERVKTLLNLRGYLCSLERYIAAHPEVRFINTSRDGAWIAGTHYHTEWAQ
jgi:hypothetical protein